MPLYATIISFSDHYNCYNCIFFRITIMHYNCIFLPAIAFLFASLCTHFCTTVMHFSALLWKHFACTLQGIFCIWFSLQWSLPFLQHNFSTFRSILAWSILAWSIHHGSWMIIAFSAAQFLQFQKHPGLKHPSREMDVLWAGVRCIPPFFQLQTRAYCNTATAALCLCYWTASRMHITMWPMQLCPESV